jgi:hypothetical protein
VTILLIFWKPIIELEKTQHVRIILRQSRMKSRRNIEKMLKLSKNNNNEDLKTKLKKIEKLGNLFENTKPSIYIKTISFRLGKTMCFTSS